MSVPNANVDSRKKGKTNEHSKTIRPTGRV